VKSVKLDPIGVFKGLGALKTFGFYYKFLRRPAPKVSVLVVL